MIFYQFAFVFHVFFNVFTYAATSADLIPPFIPDSNGLFGLWELSGAAQAINENEIMLVPPLQYSKGGAWTSVELPKIDFQVNFEICFSVGTGGGGFAIWFVNQYDECGPLNGGPTSFNGITLLCTLYNKGTELHFHLLQNDGKDQYYTNSLPAPDFIMKIASNENISLSFQIKKGCIIIYSTNLEKEIIKEEMIVSIDNSFMGITAQTDILTSRFILKRIELQFGQFIKDRKVSRISSNSKNSIHYQPDFTRSLRNPLFSSTIQEIEKMREGINQREQASISHLLTIIDESNSVSYEVVSFKELNKFVLETLIPFTQKWHKRTVKIVEESYNLRNTFNLAWNHTQNIMKVFNSSVNKNMMKTKLKIIDLEDILINNSSVSFIQNDFSEDLSFKAKYSLIVIVLFVISIIEIFAVCLLFIYINSPKFYHNVKTNVK